MYRRLSAVIIALVLSSLALGLMLVGFGGVAEVYAQGPVRIRDIQGAGHTSPLVGQVVTEVHGIVTVVELGDGFYMQDPNPDADEATSEGIFVDDVTVFPAPFDEVLITGTVEEAGFGSDLTTTRLEIIGTPTISSSGNVITSLVTIIGTGGRIPPNQNIDDDGLTSFDPANDAIDFYESLEGMVIAINDALVVGPTSQFGEIPVVANDGANAGPFTNEGGLLLAGYDDPNPERLIFDDEIVSLPQVRVGDKFSGPIGGAVSYSFGNFKIISPAFPPLPPASGSTVVSETTTLTGSEKLLTLASFNVLNLDPNPADAEDDGPRFTALGEIIANNLQAPDIIGLQEIQDNSGTISDTTVSASATYTTLIAAISAAGGPTYDYREIAPENLQDGGQPGANIRVGFLFNPARVTFVDRGSGDATTAVTVTTNVSGTVELSLSPGRIDPTNSAFFESRKPLAAEFEFNGEKVYVVNAHFNSKSDDDALFGSVQPPQRSTEVQREAIAGVVNSFVDDILAAEAGAKVVVLGDLNDFHFSSAVSDTLTGGVLTNLMDQLPANDKYTFIFDGNSQTLDHILVSNSLLAGASFDIVHVNTNFPASVAASDHDPVVARVFVGERLIYLPVISKS